MYRKPQEHDASLNNLPPKIEAKVSTKRQAVSKTWSKRAFVT